MTANDTDVKFEGLVHRSTHDSRGKRFLRTKSLFLSPWWHGFYMTGVCAHNQLEWACLLLSWKYLSLPLQVRLSGCSFMRWGQAQEKVWLKLMRQRWEHGLLPSLLAHGLGAERRKNIEESGAVKGRKTQTKRHMWETQKGEAFPLTLTICPADYWA